MRDYEEKSYYEIQLDNKQLILVFLAAVTVCVLIFVLGVMIGKGQKEAEFAAAARNQKNSAPAEPDNNAPAQALSDVSSDAGQEDKITPIEPVEEKPVQEKPKQVVENKPVQEKPAQVAQEKPAQATEEPKKQPSTLVAAPPEKAKEKYAYEDLDKPDEAPAETKEKSEPAKTAAATPSDKEESQSAGSSRYTVQVMATSSKPKAQAQISKLQSRGYQPFLDETKSGDLMVFKVRVGRFADTKDAKEMASKIKNDMKLETWVAVLD